MSSSDGEKGQVPAACSSEGKCSIVLECCALQCWSVRRLSVVLYSAGLLCYTVLESCALFECYVVCCAVQCTACYTGITDYDGPA